MLPRLRGVPQVTVKLHGAYSQFAGGTRSATVEASDIAGALAGLVERHPSLAERLRDEHGKLRDHVNIFANTEEMRFLDGERTALRDGDVVDIVPAVSGGEV
jgi:molybdopterin synthase sulfur carrier subunit